ncbi:DMT family transporter [Seleniivibrio woodruffii]|uniref:Drug/metabolite transporter (DMT)-like permease n=1 Tax=Seleniivibrio woodruffii TaxID=1078050 RepID=A0A4R1KC27_9BACT|nr:DMT family transporter [Seleniivibrio woodruffii]TCK62062.1 drug/metabolite transporter (DMT)-like permease [Seleniivibrio woodruffii]TVZ34821.1 drug/metabolite transporter (DMT)-like permease [Seleniivibrio woodruffii]
MSDMLFYIMMVLAMVSWGESWVSAKAVAGSANTDILMFYRFLLTFISYIPVVIFMKETFRINLKGLGFTFLCSMVMIVYNEMFFTGLRYGLASIGGLLVTTLIPVMTFLIVSVANRKIPAGKDIFGLVLGMCGAMIIMKIWNADIDTLFSSGNIFFLAASVVWGFVTYLGGYVRKYTTVLTNGFYMYLFCTLIAGALVLIKGSSTAVPHTFMFWGNMVLLSVAATTFGTTLFFLAATRLGSQKTSSFVYLVPVNALVMSWLFLGEEIHLNTIAGGLLAFCAIYIINKKPKPTL